MVQISVLLALDFEINFKLFLLISPKVVSEKHFFKRNYDFFASRIHGMNFIAKQNSGIRGLNNFLYYYILELNKNVFVGLFVYFILRIKGIQIFGPAEFNFFHTKLCTSDFNAPTCFLLNIVTLPNIDFQSLLIKPLNLSKLVQLEKWPYFFLQILKFSTINIRGRYFCKSLIYAKYYNVKQPRYISFCFII